MIVTLINNRFTKKDDAKISIFSDAFERGYGIFETLRTYNKKIFLAKEHVNRLQESAKKVEIKINYSEEKLLEMLNKVIKKSPHKNQRLKIIVIPNQTIITSNPHKEIPKIYEGVKVKSINCLRPFPEIKSISYLPSFLSHKIAEKEDCYDAILIDKSEEVYEGAYSNIFWFKNNTLYTREKEVLQGITRELVKKLNPYKFAYKNIKLKELKNADEVFLTQSTRGIVPIIQIDNQKINNGKPGEKTKILMEKYKELTELK